MSESNPDHPTKVLLSAGFGGAATPVLELVADARVQGWSQALSWEEILVILALAAVGSGFTWTQKETDMKKALYLGVTAPALILGAGGAADSVPANQGAGLIPHVVLVQPLHAAEQHNTSETRSISIETDAAVTGDFYIRDSNWGDGTKLPRHDGDDSWVLSTGEVTVLFRGWLNERIPVETPWTEIPSGAQPITVHLQVEEPRQTFWGNILDGLAMDNRAREHMRSDATIKIPQ